MIIDSLENASKYYALHPEFEAAFQCLSRPTLQDLQPGRYEVGVAAYANLSENELKDPAEVNLEVHDRYIDIQLCLHGAERFGWRSRGGCQVLRSPVDASKDIGFFADEPSFYFTLTPGEFAVFFPEDAHAPLVGNGTVRKCIIKVPV